MQKVLVRRWLAGAAALVIGIAPVAAIQLDGGIAGATTTADVITYAQATTSSSFNFIPGGGGATTNEAISPSGSCKTPTTVAAPLLSLSALVYGHPVGGVPYTGTPTSVPVGTSLGHTGVCSSSYGSEPYLITEGQSLTVAPGPNALTSTRTFGEIKVPLAITSTIDTGTDGVVQGNHAGSSQSVTVTLIARNGSSVVSTQSLVIKGDGDGDADDTVTADTGAIKGGFTSLEIRVTSCSSTKFGVSVVGTTTTTLLQLPQAITFTNTPPSSPPVGSSYTVAATGGASGNLVTFSVGASSTSGCTVVSATGVVTLTAPAGTCVIDANQAGNATYAPAPQVSQTVTSALIPQAIVFTDSPPAGLVVGGSFTVTAMGGGSGNPLTFSVDPSSTAGCSLDATGDVSFTGPAGTCDIDANQAGNSTYSAAPTASLPIAVGVAPQTITYTSTPPQVALVGGTYAVTATGGGSDNPVVLTIDASSTSGCTIDTSTGVVTFTAPTGTCVIDANQAGSPSYAPAPQAQQDLTVYAQEICGQQVISTSSDDGSAESGQVSATFTFAGYDGGTAPTTTCKGYTTFDASADSPVEGLTGNQSVDFAAQSLATAHMTATITWAVQSFCTPDGSGDTTICPPTYVSFDGGQTWVPQTYCSSAQAAGLEWCTTGRSYAFTADGTQITETWDGFGDPLFHHG